MAPPPYPLRGSLSFKDAKGNRARMQFLIGGTDAGADIGQLVTLKTNAQTASNAHVTTPISASRDNNYGTNGTFQSVEDKAVLVFQSPEGKLSRFQLPAPKTGVFYADQETVSPTGLASSLIESIETFVYGDQNDSSALQYVGGYRLRRANQRKVNVWTLAPTEDEPAE